MSVPRSQSSPDRKPASLGASSAIVLCGLLTAPAYALCRLSAAVDWRLLIGLPASLSLIAFLVYRSDKRRAQAGEWRVPEAALHLVALLGGWPGAFLAQRVLRHKTSKASFQFVFWCVVLLHQFAAVDSVLGWRLSKELLRAIQ